MSTKKFERLMAAKECILEGSGRRDFTLTTWYDYWRNHYKIMTVKQGTIESYDKIFSMYVEPFLGDEKLEGITGDKLQSLYNELAVNDYAKATLSLIHALLSNMFRYAYRLQLIEKNPLELVELPRCREKKSRRVLSRTEQELLLKYAKGTEIDALVFLALATGMRIGEIVGLTWNHINFEKGEIYVCEILKRSRNGEFYKDSPKTKKSVRVIPMLPQLAERLKKYREIKEWQNTYRGVDGQLHQKLGNLVFTRPDGTPYSDQIICRLLRRVVAQINRDDIRFEPITPHCLRHTFATRALENGIPAKVVQELLGHSSITLTLDLYTHVLYQTKNDEMQKMSALF